MTLNDSSEDFNIDRFVPYLYWNNDDGSYWLNMSTVSQIDIQLTPANSNPEAAYPQAIATLKMLVAREMYTPRAWHLPGRLPNIIAAVAGFVVTFSPVLLSVIAG
jgi:hypothetical protein